MEHIAKVQIDARVEDVWELLSSPREWWLESNPEHEEIQIPGSERKLEVGSELRIRERIAGARGDAVGEIVELEPGRRAVWFASAAKYRWWGLEIEVEEGVEWVVEPRGEGSELSAKVWAIFPPTWKGRIGSWIFEHVLDGPARDFDHAMTELQYLKGRLEDRSE